jgi:hypothetical protein
VALLGHGRGIGHEPVGERKEFTDEILQKRTRENNA